MKKRNKKKNVCAITRFWPTLAGQAVNDKIRELGLEEVSVMNDTPQERARKNIQFDPLPQEMNHIRDLFLNIEPLVDFK